MESPPRERKRYLNSCCQETQEGLLPGPGHRLKGLAGPSESLPAMGGGGDVR